MCDSVLLPLPAAMVGVLTAFIFLSYAHCSFHGDRTRDTAEFTSALAHHPRLVDKADTRSIIWLYFALIEPTGQAHGHHGARL